MPTLHPPVPAPWSASRPSRARVVALDALRALVLFLVVLALTASTLVALPQAAVADDAALDHLSAAGLDELHFDDGALTPPDELDLGGPSLEEPTQPAEEGTAPEEDVPGVEPGEVGPGISGGMSRSPNAAGWGGGSALPGTGLEGWTYVYSSDEGAIDRPWSSLGTRGPFAFYPVTNPLLITKSPSTAAARTTNVFFSRSAAPSSAPANISDYASQRLTNLSSTSGTGNSLLLLSNFTPRDA